MGFDTAFLEERGIVPCVAVFDLLRNRQVKGLHSPAPSGRAGGDGAEQLTGEKQQLHRLLPHLLFLGGIWGCLICGRSLRGWWNGLGRNSRNLQAFCKENPMEPWDGETAPTVPKTCWELGGRRVGEREECGHAAFHYSHHSWGFFGDDSCSPVLRQNQQVLPKLITDPSRCWGLGLAGKAVGKGLISAGIPWMEVQGEQEKLSGWGSHYL